jgi:hypothetical protein
MVISVKVFLKEILARRKWNSIFKAQGIPKTFMKHQGLQTDRGKSPGWAGLSIQNAIFFLLLQS